MEKERIDRFIKIDKEMKELKKEHEIIRKEIIKYCAGLETNEIESSLGKIKVIKKSKCETDIDSFWDTITRKAGKHQKLFQKIVEKLQFKRILKPNITECKKVFSEKDCGTFIKKTGETFQVTVTN